MLMPADEADEVFEIVDEDNRTIGTELRKVVHQTGLLHRSVYCFVFNPDGELLIQQRAARCFCRAFDVDHSGYRLVLCDR